MSDHESEPPWHYLPHAAEQFFGLSKGFTRVDLKRAYNQWIRRFRPEKHPAEFQRIREAYQRLEQRLVNGEYEEESNNADTSDSFSIAHVHSHVEDDANETSSQEESETAEPLESKARPPLRRSLLERIESDSTANVYRELADEPIKSPADFYTLAVLSDLAETELRRPFVYWLLQGLESYQDHYLLLRLLREYFERNPNHVFEDPKTFQQLLSIGGPHRFFYVTQHLWDEALKNQPWPKVQNWLETCERYFFEQPVAGMILFYSRFLRRAVWVAPGDWIEAKLKYLEEQNADRYHVSDFQHELTAQLVGYVAARETFTQRGELAVRMDRALHDYCWLPPAEARRSFVECQCYLARHADQVLELFSTVDNEVVQQMYAWLWLSDECLEQSPVKSDQQEFNSYVMATLKVLSAIDTFFPKSVLENYQQIRHGFIALFIISGVLGFVLTRDSPDRIWYLVVGLHLFVMAIYRRWIGPKYVEPWFEAAIGRVIRKHYRMWWRSLICRFFAATHFDFHLVRRAIDFNLQRRTNRFGTCTWLPYLLPGDVGIQIYATAVRFLH